MPLPIASESTVVKERERVYVMPQAAAGTMTVPVGADPTTTTGGPMRVLSSDIAVSQSHEPHGFSQEGQRDFVGSMYPTMRECTWTLQSRLIPPRSLAGTIVPETHHLMVAIFGRYTYTGGTITYLPDAKPRASLLTLARLVNATDRIFGEWLPEAIPNAAKFEFRGGQPPTVEFSGEAGRHIAASATTLTSAMSATATAPVAAAYAADPGALVSVGADTNGGAGYEVSSFSAPNAMVLGEAVTASDGAEVRPWMPDPTYSDQPPVGALEGGITLDGLAIPLQSLMITIDWGTTFVKDEYGSDGLTDGVPGKQAITGEVTLRATESVMARISRAKRFGTGTLALAIGDGTTGRNQNMTAPNVLYDVSKLSLDQVGSVVIPFRCLDSADGSRDALSYSVA